MLTGRAQAQAIAHLEECGAYRDHVRRFAITAGELLAPLPSSEPPAGFETRVRSRLGSAGRRRRRWPGSRWLLATAHGTILATACFSATR